MPPNSQIPDTDNLARHCTKSRDFVDPDVMTELTPGTFAPTEDDPDVSVNWIEYYEGTFDDRIDAVCKDMSSERDVRASHKLALLQVAELREIGEGCDVGLSAYHDPYPKNDSHAVIRGVPLEAMILHQELADAASQHLVSVVPYKKQT